MPPGIGSIDANNQGEQSSSQNGDVFSDITFTTFTIKTSSTASISSDGPEDGGEARAEY